MRAVIETIRAAADARYTLTENKPTVEQAIYEKFQDIELLELRDAFGELR
jgi:hypothetical protein